jgi:predicted  nucleic acid-binding Zn-ribbon protein
METQSRVLAMLNKTKQVRESRKELGAIEDAINEVKSNIEASETEMYDLLNNFNNELDNSKTIINNEIDAVKEYSFDYDNEFGNAKLNYQENLSELKSAGIDYDESTAEKIMSDFDIAINSLQNIFSAQI